MHLTGIKALLFGFCRTEKVRKRCECELRARIKKKEYQLIDWRENGERRWENKEENRQKRQTTL